MTMSQMDRLYGVTMAEPGVSKLVSVDLQTAETLREDEWLILSMSDIKNCLLYTSDAADE